MDHIFNENQPIYQQIIQRIEAKIMRGEYQPGTKLPSVVEGAMLYKVNHNTMARVYSELVRAEILVVKRGEGTFVTEDETVLSKMAGELRDSLIQDFTNEIKALGFSITEILPLLLDSSKTNPGEKGGK